MAWAAIPNAPLASFWSSSRKSTNLWFAGLKTSFLKLCLAVAIDWGFTYSLRKTARLSPRSSRVGPLMFLNVCNASPLMREKSSWFPPLHSVDYEFLDSFGKDLQNSSNFSDFPSTVGIVFVSDFGHFEILLILFWKFAELLLFANCWSANKIWSASIVAGVFSLRSCGWLVERFFFCFPEDVLGEQYVTSSWTPVTKSRRCRVSSDAMSWLSSGSEFCIVRLPRMPASGWGSLWESSWFVPWFELNTFRYVSGAVPQRPWIRVFVRKSSIRASAPSMRFYDLLKSYDNFLVTLASIYSETWVM